ncbi:hypothetical protein DPMN_048446 [Dreissena polymorpha]|uniref:Uncharacterized protein n=1 Tax=Dreissena polymorpha TaxID=45954 RepID=A0A9D4D9M0_DREPO|nr:hypothetical protein DPMN_048446 [Dreissena polymorpha]
MRIGPINIMAFCWDLTYSLCLLLAINHTNIITSKQPLVVNGSRIAITHSNCTDKAREQGYVTIVIENNPEEDVGVESGYPNDFCRFGNNWRSF